MSEWVSYWLRDCEPNSTFYWNLIFLNPVLDMKNDGTNQLAKFKPEFRITIAKVLKQSTNLTVDKKSALQHNTVYGVVNCNHWDWRKCSFFNKINVLLGLILISTNNTVWGLHTLGFVFHSHFNFVLMFAIYLLCQIIEYYYNTAIVILSIDKMSDFTSEFTFVPQYSGIIKILFLNVL